MRIHNGLVTVLDRQQEPAKIHHFSTALHVVLIQGGDFPLEARIEPFVGVKTKRTKSAAKNQHLSGTLRHFCHMLVISTAIIGQFEKYQAQPITNRKNQPYLFISVIIYIIYLYTDKDTEVNAVNCPRSVKSENKISNKRYDFTLKSIF